MILVSEVSLRRLSRPCTGDTERESKRKAALMRNIRVVCWIKKNCELDEPLVLRTYHSQVLDMNRGINDDQWGCCCKSP